MTYLHEEYAGRPTPLYYAKNLNQKYGGVRIYLKQEDLLHGGLHKMNNALGQALLARKLGRKRISLRREQASTAWLPQWRALL